MVNTSGSAITIVSNVKNKRYDQTEYVQATLAADLFMRQLVSFDGTALTAATAVANATHFIAENDQVMVTGFVDNREGNYAPDAKVALSATPKAVSLWRINPSIPTDIEITTVAAGGTYR